MWLKMTIRDMHTKKYKVALISKVNGKKSTLSGIEFHQFAELTGQFNRDYYKAIAAIPQSERNANKNITQNPGYGD